jgi:hypothetical protein
MCLDHSNSLFFIHSDFFVLTQRQKVNYASYHRYYSPAPLRAPRATKEGTYDTSEFEATRTRVQRSFASSSVRSALRLDPSNCGSGFSYGKCAMVATNIEWDPQRTPLAAAASIRPSSSSIAVDIDATREDNPSALSSTKS